MRDPIGQAALTAQHMIIAAQQANGGASPAVGAAAGIIKNRPRTNQGRLFGILVWLF